MLATKPPGKDCCALRVKTDRLIIVTTNRPPFSPSPCARALCALLTGHAMSRTCLVGSLSEPRLGRRRARCLHSLPRVAVAIFTPALTRRPHRAREAGPADDRRNIGLPPGHLCPSVPPRRGAYPPCWPTWHDGRERTATIPGRFRQARLGAANTSLPPFYVLPSWMRARYRPAKLQGVNSSGNDEACHAVVDSHCHDAKTREPSTLCLKSARVRRRGSPSGSLYLQLDMVVSTVSWQFQLCPGTTLQL